MLYKILVVEDDQPILELMDLLLKKLGYEPVLVTDGFEALSLIKKDPPALILLDIMMAPINGWDFLATLREKLGLKDIPVLLFTASPEADEKIQQLNDPHLGILHKPVSLSELRSGIVRFLP